MGQHVTRVMGCTCECCFCQAIWEQLLKDLGNSVLDPGWLSGYVAIVPYFNTP